MNQDHDVARFALELLRAEEDMHADAWPWIANARKGQGLSENAIETIKPSKWPAWCYVPYGATIWWHSMHHHEAHPVGCGDSIATIASWRQTKGVYRVNKWLPTLWSVTGYDGTISMDVFKRLPEWCIYICLDGNYSGVFVWLDYDYIKEEPMLRITYRASDDAAKWYTMNIYMKECNIDEGIEKYKEVMFDRVRKYMPSDDVGAIVQFRHAIKVAKSMIPYILYICSENADIELPPHPSTYKTKGGKGKPAEKPTVYDVGAHVGEEIRRAIEAGREDISAQWIQSQKVRPDGTSEDILQWELSIPVA